MIRSVLNKIQSRFCRPPAANPAPTCWEVYRNYLAIDPTVIIDQYALLKLFSPPTPPSVCLEIGEGSHIFANLNLLRSEARIRIGKRCQIGASTIIAAKSIEIGDDVLMAWGITLMDTDAHSLVWAERKNDVIQCYKDYLDGRENIIKNKDWSHVATEAIKIGNKVWIGFNAAILKGVTIGEGSVVGACSVVMEDVPADSLVVGNPAKVVKKIDNETR